MKARSPRRAAKVDGAPDGTRAPLRRALIAAGTALLLGAALWLSAEDQPLPAGPARAPSAPAVLAAPPPAEAAREVPPDAVAAAQPDPAKPSAAPAPPAPAAAVPEAVVLVTKPAGPVLQLGVFGAEENAQRLRDELVRKGFPARVESRVVLGPYTDRAAAEAAQAALKHAGQGGGMVVPPRAP